MARVLYRAGVLKPIRPDKTIRIVRAAKGWGRSPAMGFIAMSIREPDTVAVIDDDGSATFDEVGKREKISALLYDEEFTTLLEGL